MLKLENVICNIRGKTRLQVKQLSSEAGQLTGIIGPNGAGKTTLFKAITGELRSQGHILFHHKPLSDWPSLQRARHLAVLPQTSETGFSFIAEEVVSLGLTPLSLNKRDASLAVQTYMKKTDCLHLANHPYPLLSGGERQRVQLARVLLQLSQADSTPLLLLDEPTSAQDLGQQHNILELAQSLCKQQQFSILAILHDLNQVIRYCDQCALLNQGVLSKTGHPADILSEDSIEFYWQYRPTRLQFDGNKTAFI